MHLSRYILLCLTLLLSSACTVHMRSRPFPLPAPPPPSVPQPAPPPPTLMSYDEAVARGWNYCQQRSYPCELKEAHLNGRDNWKVKFAVRGPQLKGHVHLEFDAYSRELRRADEKVKVRKHKGKGRGKYDDDEDDD